VLQRTRAKVRAHVDVEAGRERLGAYLDGWLVGREEAKELKRSTLADYRDLQAMLNVCAFLLGNLGSLCVLVRL